MNNVLWYENLKACFLDIPKTKNKTKKIAILIRGEYVIIIVLSILLRFS